MATPWARDDSTVLAAKLTALATHHSNVRVRQQECFDRLLWNLDLQIYANLPKNENDRRYLLAAFNLGKQINWKDAKIRIQKAAHACVLRFWNDLKDLVTNSSSILRKDIAFLTKNPRDGHLDALEKSVRQLTSAIETISKRLKVSDPSLINWANDSGFYSSAVNLCELAFAPLEWLDESLSSRLAGTGKPGRPVDHAVKARDARLRELKNENPKSKNTDLADAANNDDVIGKLGFARKITEQMFKDLARRRGSKKRNAE